MQQQSKSKFGTTAIAVCVLVALLTSCAAPPPAPVPATVAPTATVAVPTVAPTATAIPTLVVAPTEDITEKQYIVGVQGVLALYTEATSALVPLFTQAAEDPQLFLDDTWKTQVGGMLGFMKVGAGITSELIPPPKYSAHHAELLIAAIHISLAADLYAKGIDELDPGAVQAGAAELNKGTDALLRSDAIWKALH